MSNQLGAKGFLKTLSMSRHHHHHHFLFLFILNVFHEGGAAVCECQKCQRLSEISVNGQNCTHGYAKTSILQGERKHFISHPAIAHVAYTIRVASNLIKLYTQNLHFRFSNNKIDQIESGKLYFGLIIIYFCIITILRKKMYAKRH